MIVARIPNYLGGKTAAIPGVKKLKDRDNRRQNTWSTITSILLDKRIFTRVKIFLYHIEKVNIYYMLV